MQAHRIPDRNLKKRCAKAFDQVHRIGIRPVRRPKARHRNGFDALARQAQSVKRLHRNKQRQGRIQPAGNADYRAAAVPETLIQTRRLNHKDLVAAPFPLFPPARHKRRRIDKTCQLHRLPFQ